MIMQILYTGMAVSVVIVQIGDLICDVLTVPVSLHQPFS